MFRAREQHGEACAQHRHLLHSHLDEERRERVGAFVGVHRAEQRGLLGVFPAASERREALLDLSVRQTGRLLPRCGSERRRLRDGRAFAGELAACGRERLRDVCGEAVLLNHGCGDGTAHPRFDVVELRARNAQHVSDWVPCG
eukprot:2770490-Prymnesium_polylepis.1